MKKTFVTFLLSFLALSAAVTSLTLGDDEKKAQPPGAKTRAEALSVLMVELRAHDRSSDFTWSFVLGAEEFSTLENLLTGLTDHLYRNGYYKDANTMSLERLAKELIFRLYSVLPGEQDEILQRLDYHPNGPTAQWLDDRGWHPEVLYIVREVAKGKTVDFAVLAKEREVAEKKYRETPHLIPNSLSAPPVIGLGSQQMSQGAAILRAQAFELDRSGRPKAYDPILRNLQEHAKNFRFVFANDAVKRPDTGFANWRDSWRYRSDRFFTVTEALEAMELATHDLQGMSDAIRFKITLAENTFQVHQLNLMLARTLKLRADLVARSAAMFGIPGLEQMDFHPTYTAVRPHLASIVETLGQIRKTISADIDLIDKILSHDDTETERFQWDCPFELRFKFDERNAEHADLKEYWESVRTHQYKVKEIYKTEHWTTTVEDTDSKGNKTTRTVHHDTNWTEWVMATMQTPAIEMKMARDIETLRDRLLKAEGREAISELRDEIDALMAKQEKYTQTEPAGEHDYSDKYLDRNRTLLKQLNALYQQSFLLEVKTEGKIKDYNRKLLPFPKYARQLDEFLKMDDAGRGRIRRITYWTAGSVVGLATAGWAACHFLLNGGGL